MKRIDTSKIFFHKEETDLYYQTLISKYYFRWLDSAIIMFMQVRFNDMIFMDRRNYETT